MTRLTLPALLVVVALPTLGMAATGAKKTRTPFDAVKIIIEFNSTDQDAGVQLSLDAEAWKSVSVLDPKGRRIFDVNPKGVLKSLGGGELFLESDEPALADVPLEHLFTQFPEGTYTFVGKSPDGGDLKSTATFSHTIPDGPSIASPATLDPAHAVIAGIP